MPAFLKDLIVITPILVGAAYGVMRLVVWLMTMNGKRPNRCSPSTSTPCTASSQRRKACFICYIPYIRSA